MYHELKHSRFSLALTFPSVPGVGSCLGCWVSVHLQLTDLHETERLCFDSISLIKAHYLHIELVQV